MDIKCGSQYPSVQATKSGAALKVVLKLSKHLVAYIESLLAVCPYVNGPFNFQAKGVAEAVAAVALTDLNNLKLANKPYGLPQAQARELVQRGPKTRAQALATSGRCEQTRASF
jgi:hypothetical protein